MESPDRVDIVTIRDIEDCLDGSYIKELQLSHEITEAFIKALGSIGDLQYFPHFPRPFFRVDAKGVMFKGIQSNDTIRVVIWEQEKFEVLQNKILAFST